MRVTLHEITKRFGSTGALEGVSLEINDGELLALVGPSGCGKTTLLRVVAGLETPDSGDILFDGQSMLRVPPERRRVGLVFQNYALFPHMTVFHNIAYGLKFAQNLPVSVPGRVRELLKLMGLEGLEDRMPSELSAGQQQRVALARALAPNPNVLLLDEPLSALDAKLRERLRVEMKKIQRAFRITTLYVTHDQEEALAVADRVAVMSVARIEQVGAPTEIYNAPATEFVARFIGRGNLLQGRVVRCDREELVLSVGDGFIRARADGSLWVGQEIAVLVRPERIRFDRYADNILMGTVVGREFAGDALWLHIETAAGVLVVKADAAQSIIADGDAVQIGFSAADVWVVTDRRSPSTPSR